MDIQRHSGPVVLITGAGSGIGKASGIRFAEEGARVIGCDEDAEGLGPCDRGQPHWRHATVSGGVAGHA